MRRITPPDRDLWSRVAEVDTWTELTCPEDMATPAPLAAELAKQWGAENSRLTHVIVTDPSTLYVKFGPFLIDVPTLMVREWMERYTIARDGVRTPTASLWESFVSYCRDEHVDPARRWTSVITPKRFEGILTSEGFPSTSARVGRRVLRVRPGLALRETPITSEESAIAFDEMVARQVAEMSEYEKACDEAYEARSLTEKPLLEK